MKLSLPRRTSGVSCTIGELFVNSHTFCDTIEDVVREVPWKHVSEWKIPKETAIPQGVYVIRLTVSERARNGHLWTPRRDFKLPQIMDVPGFDGVRIHAANTAVDVEGCIGVGTWPGGECLYKSRPKLEALIDLLRVAELGGETVQIEILNSAEGM